MITTEQKNELLKKIKHSFFIEEKLKDQLLTNTENLSDENWQDLNMLFSSAEKKQSELMAKMLRADPNFLEKMKNFEKQAFQKAFQSAEKSERNNENPEEILKAMK